jgi:hypothetical protein
VLGGRFRDVADQREGARLEHADRQTGERQQYGEQPQRVSGGEQETGSREQHKTHDNGAAPPESIGQ